MPDNEWTLMFYFASDNPLAPGIISQLKAIKAAGFHNKANVIAQFDPYTPGTPTHIFDVNIIKKLESPDEFNIGFDSEDPFIRNLVEDKLWRDETDRSGTTLIRDRIKATVKGYQPGVPRAGTVETNGHRYELSPLQSLEEFLRFCGSRYPAKRYMLFILGHGVVVGNDVFLFDEHASEQSLSLTGLRRVLENFKLDIRSHDGSFELISFHSCSVSALEVAYELKDTANYMLASQGTTFVGSWPYREILLRIFKDLRTSRNDMKDTDIREMLIKIFSYCLHNSTDFLLAGYPFDLCLCDLTKMETVKPRLNRLAAALMKAVEKCPYKEKILLAHLEAQSFYGEMYTDIIDFCRRLYLRTGGVDDPMQRFSNGPIVVDRVVPDDAPALLPDPALNQDASGNNQALVVASHPSEIPFTSSDSDPIIREVQEACVELIRAIRKSIVRRGFAGPEYQYARGLSIYFPWSRPSADSGLLDAYAKYKIVAEDESLANNNMVMDAQQPIQGPESPVEGAKSPGWLDFLDAYFDYTRREKPIFAEKPFEILGEQYPRQPNDAQKLLEDKIALVYTQAAPNTAPNVAGGLQKTDKTDPMGGDCSCPSIKNFPRDTRPRRERKQPSADSRAFSPAFFRQSS